MTSGSASDGEEEMGLDDDKIIAETEAEERAEEALSEMESAAEVLVEEEAIPMDVDGPSERAAGSEVVEPAERMWEIFEDEFGLHDDMREDGVYPDPGHPAVEPGSVWGNRKAGNCFWKPIAAARGCLIMQTKLEFFRRLSRGARRDDPYYIELRARTFPGGVVPKGKAWVEHARGCTPELWPDQGTCRR